MSTKNKQKKKCLKLTFLYSNLVYIYIYILRLTIPGRLYSLDLIVFKNELYLFGTFFYRPQTSIKINKAKGY
jgi:hypothetical protein